ncbi:hypothetical protein IR073_06195 [Gemella sp. 19428wG2_WT2a]|nr:hypothetical protein [Gemella sp. 19428wG2_WT2a]
MSAKIGRPLAGESRKGIDLKVRVTKDIHDKLLEYSKENNITKAEAVRRGIELIIKKD